LSFSASPVVGVVFVVGMTLAVALNWKRRPRPNGADVQSDPEQGMTAQPVSIPDKIAQFQSEAAREAEGEKEQTDMAPAHYDVPRNDTLTLQTTSPNSQDPTSSTPNPEDPIHDEPNAFQKFFRWRR
jgi:hypothetical protein